MTVELLQTASLVAFIAAGILFLVAVALFFLLDVPKLYGDISGRTAKKAIEAIRQQNESSGNKAYKPSPVNAERGKLTDRITKSGSLQPQTSGSSIGVGTEKFSTSTLFQQSNETTVLQNTASETTVLTGLLPVEGGETTLLVNEEPNVGPAPAEGTFVVDVEMFFTGSSEIIE